MVKIELDKVIDKALGKVIDCKSCQRGLDNSCPFFSDQKPVDDCNFYQKKNGDLKPETPAEGA